ncbi:T9SS type A sorting domain-containing protein, partial [bacterium]
RINDFTVLENKILIAGRFGIKESENYGMTFSQSDTNTVKNNFNISKIAQTGSNELLAFSIFNGVFKSSDNANTWELLVDSLPTDTTFASIEKFYEFGGSYYIVNSSPLRILKSNDRGISWSKLEIDLFENIDAHYLEMIDENNILLSSYGNGINGLRITNNQGKTWRRIDDNLPLQSEINENNKFIYSILGRAGNNIFIGSMTESYLHGNLFVSSLEKLGVKTSVETQRNYLYTYPPYPLPAKSEVKVLFYWDINIPMTVDDISIYDLLGQKIEAKNNLKLIKQANHYGNVIWDCSTTPAGIYLINIKHGTESKSVKVVVE